MPELVIDDFSVPWTSSDEETFISKNSTFYTRECTQSQKVLVLRDGSMEESISLERTGGSGVGLDLRPYKEINIWVNSARPGTWLWFSIGKDDYEEIVFPISIATANAWELKRFYIGDLSPTILQDVKFFQFKVLDTEPCQTVPYEYHFYLDGFRAVTNQMFYDEESVILNLLETISVDGSPIRVRMKSPDKFVDTEELPGISVWLYDWLEASERSWSGQRIVSDLREVNAGLGTVTARVRKAGVKYDLYYQVDTYAYYGSHDRQLLVQLMDLLPERGSIRVNGVDSFVQRMGVATLDNVEDVPDASKLYRKSFTYRVESELDLQNATPEYVAWRPEFLVLPKSYRE